MNEGSNKLAQPLTLYSVSLMFPDRAVSKIKETLMTISNFRLAGALFTLLWLFTGTAYAEKSVVHFNAWGGSPAINAYIQWVAQEVKSRHGITLRHVKLTDTASAVSRSSPKRRLDAIPMAVLI